MDRGGFVDATPDNTKVSRIMGDFRDFLSTQRSASSAWNSPVLPIRLQNDEEVPAISSHSNSSEMQMSNLDLKVKMKHMETDYSCAKKAYIKANIKLEEQCEKLTAQNFKLSEKCDTLQLKNKQLTEQNIDMIDKVKDAEKQKNDDISKWENSYNQLETLKQECDQRVSDELSSHVAKNKELLDQNMSLQSQANTMALRLDEAYAHMELYKNKADEAAHAMHENHHTTNQLIKAEQQVQQLTARLANTEDIEQLAKTFKDDLNRLRQLELEYKKLKDENSVLRENQENIALLNEKLLSAESKLLRAESRCSEVDRLESINEILMSKLKQHESQYADHTNINRLQVQVSELHHLVQLYEEKNTTLQSDYDNMRKKYAEETDARTRLDTKLTEQMESAASLSAQLLRLRKRASLLAHERDSIRAILQSYDAELTMTSHTTQLNKRLENAVETNTKLHARIEQLEQEVQNSTEEAMRQKLLVKQLEMNASQIQNATDVKSLPHSSLSPEEVECLKQKVEDYENEHKSLKTKVDQLETCIARGKLRGQYDPEHTKVIHFSVNPVNLARQKLKQDLADLKTENAKLKQKLKQLQQDHEVSMSEFEVSQNVKEQLSTAELRNQRLKEVFSKKIQEFRQACYSLTGYRIDTSSDSKFKLVSMYAESSSDYLLFEMKPDGEMQLLETEYSKTLEELISLHLHYQNSIPMFLSALSVNLFSQQTMMTS